MEYLSQALCQALPPAPRSGYHCLATEPALPGWTSAQSQVAEHEALGLPAVSSLYGPWDRQKEVVVWRAGIV
jgi:hypothetical protein